MRWEIRQDPCISRGSRSIGCMHSVRERELAVEAPAVMIGETTHCHLTTLEQPVSRRDGGVNMKLAVIGAGSTYTPELISGLMRERERIDVRELVLHDIDPDRREVVGGLARRILERQGFSGALAITGELDRALDGADAILIQIR